MQKLSRQQARSRQKSLFYTLLLCLCGIGANFALSELARLLRLPLFLDSLGTIAVAAIGGYLPGIVVGYVTNLIISLSDPISAYYATVNVFLALVAAWFAGRGYFKKLLSPKLLLPIVCFAIIGGGLGSVLTWLLYGFGFGDGISGTLARQLYEAGEGSVFFCQLSADLLVDLLDKTVIAVLSVLLLKLIPESAYTLLRPHYWRQAPLSEEQYERMAARRTRRSLRARIMAMVAAATLLVALAATTIGVIQFRRTTIADRTRTGVGVANLVATTLDPERIDLYLTEGEAAEGYAETEARLYEILHDLADIEYIYVYRILPDGCHVVFDLDTPDTPGSDPGTLIPFDESFHELLPTLLAGGEIDPIITNDTYGWLLTAYCPVFNAAGDCVCYAAADISMGDLTMDVLSYLVRSVALYLGLFILILVLGLWLAEFSIILPVNSMASAAGTFAFDSQAGRGDSVQHIKALDICTGDEIESLYSALVRTSEDTVRYIADIQEKSATIARMQTGLIMVLADMVESRDSSTGDHVRKTAAYVRIIAEQMRRDGVYAEQLTEDFVEDVVNSAPLHDIGKIQVSDVILNKPGKLTDEEFAIMKTHTTAGGAIIAQAIAMVSAPGYLIEAKNLASFHHERWDGCGYPEGLKGEAIPLSARIMAVADVFDALVSRRVYKPPFTFEKAMDIICEEAGTHFDPEVVRCFVNAKEQVRQVAEDFSRQNS